MSESSPDFSIPVLIYLSKNGCPACKAFEPHWEKIKQRLNGKTRFVKFMCDEHRHACPGLQKYAGWYPSIILAGPKSYFRIFTADDKVNEVDYSNSYEIKALKFNAVEEGDEFKYGGRPNTADGVVSWFNRVADRISQIDETTLPRRYNNLGNSNSSNMSKSNIESASQKGSFRRSRSGEKNVKFFI